jgi:hypothetical protein
VRRRGYGDFDPAKASQYVQSTEKMLALAKESSARVALISPNSVEPDAAAALFGRERLQKYQETQKRFYVPLKELAAKFQVPFVDQYAVTRKVLEKLESDHAGVKPFPDGVHTNPAGGLLMAHTILVGLNAPARVSTVTVDVAAKKADAAGCSVNGLEAGADRVAFERTDEALPLPVLKEWRAILPSVHELKDLNDYGLTVTGLTGGRYELTIDGQAVGTFTADQLAAGVNLGLLDKGPLYEQGMAVFKAITGKNDIVHKRFRGVVMYDPKSPDWLPAELAQSLAQARKHELATRAEQIAARQAEVSKLAEPKPHRFELTAAK